MNSTGGLAIFVAAIFWATDGLLRFHTTSELSALSVVAWEHIIALSIVGVYIFFSGNRALLKVPQKALLTLLLAGFLGSGLATLLFTASFAWVHPSLSLVLQKTQPLFVVALARVALKEKLPKYFWVFALLAITASLGIGIEKWENLSIETWSWNRGVFYSLGASALWGIATLLGRFATPQLHVVSATGLRFVGGLAFAIAFAFASQTSLLEWNILRHAKAELWLELAALSIGPGLIAMLFYYYGLKRVKASVATFIELFYTVGGIALNSIYLEIPLQTHQWVLSLVLLTSLTWMSSQRQ